MDILEYSSDQYQQAFTKFLEFLESAWILGFSVKSLQKERMAETILGKWCEFKKIYHIFLNSHSQ